MAARDSTTPEPRETEIKLRFPSEVRGQIEDHPALRPPRASRLEARDEITLYFDTPDQKLAARGVSLRVRRRGDKSEQTVKVVGQPGVAASRGEWTWAVTRDVPDLGRLAELDLELPDDLAASLRPISKTEIHRTQWKIKLDGTLVEADLDVGKIISGDRSEEVAELELELLEGDLAPLYRLALEIHADLPLSIETESKAERGRRLSGQAGPKVQKAPEIMLDAALSAARALRLMIHPWLGQLLGNLGAAATGEPEGIHQARVALRHLRTLVVLFAPQLESHVVTCYSEEIRRLGRVFGEARDWDVFLLETLPSIEAVESISKWLPLLRRPAEAARRAAHEAVKAELDRPALSGLVLSLAAWAEEGAANPELLGRGLDSPIVAVEPVLMDRLADKLDKRGRHLERHPPEKLHALRKALKKMRYAADAVASLHGRKAVKRYLKGCKALQRILGELNDLAVAVTLAGRLAAEHGTDLTPGVAALALWSEDRRGPLREQLVDAWENFQKEKRFWR